MSPSNLRRYLSFCVLHKFPVLVTGKPGIGKSEIIDLVAIDTNHDLIISHPVVSDPTDYKGLPFPTKKGVAEFLPFGDLHCLITTDRPTIFFIDDFGQATPLVQAACMQLLLAREINGKKVSPFVTFIAATNRREDKAGVSGLLEPVKSRFISIINLEVNADDWINWAILNDMPSELIAFIRFKPAMLDDFQPTKDLVNSPSPRTVAAVGKQQKAGLEKDLEFEAFMGGAGQAFAVEYTEFLKVFRELPSVDQIINCPQRAPVPNDPGAQYAICSALARKITETNIAAVITYLDRLPDELCVCCMKDSVVKNPDICNTTEFINFSTKKKLIA